MMMRRVDIQMPLVEKSPEGRRIHGVVDVCVTEDDHGVLPTQLERHPFEVAARLLGDHAAHLCRTGEADAADPRIFDEFIPYPGVPPGPFVTRFNTPFGKPAS